MVEAVNVHEAKTQLSKLLARVGQGEEITICKAGKPVAKLVPIEPPADRRRRLPGTMAGQIWMADDFDEMSEEDLALFEGTYDDSEDEPAPPEDSDDE